jgi:hypothetical protein
MTYDELRAALSAYLKRTDPETIANEPVALELARGTVGGFFFPRESEEVASLLPVDGLAPLPLDFGRAVSVGADLAYVAPRQWERLLVASPRDLMGKYTIEADNLRVHPGLAIVGMVYNRFPLAVTGAGENWLSASYPAVWLHAARAEQYRFIEDHESGLAADQYWRGLATELAGESERSRQAGGSLRMKSR